MGRDELRQPRSQVPEKLLWAIWLAGFAVWTYLLVVPHEWLPAWLRFKVRPGVVVFSWSKVGHACAYATLTAWTYLLPVSRRGWWACVALLSFHGFATEYIQTLVPDRTGCWMDVGIDNTGLLAGLLLGGLGDWCWGRLGAGRRRPQGVIAAPQAEGHARRENADADPL
jgi:VanZ family protein